MANPEESNGYQLIIAIAILLPLAYISVLLRCYVRVRITKAFQVDDWVMLAALGVYTLSCAFIICGVSYGLGRHNSSLPLNNQIEGLKYQTLATSTYVANMMFIKLSIAIFLIRISVQKVFLWILRISMVIVVIWSLAIFIYNIFQCIPVQAQWDFTIENAKCVSGESFASAAYSISVMTILSDWLYALLPIPMIWKVQMSKQTKITVAIILSLGVFASVATIIRLKYIVDLVVLSDVLFTGTIAMVWTLVEPGVAIIAASLITIRPLLRALRFSGFESEPSRNGYQRSTSRARPHNISFRNDPEDGHWVSSTISSNGTELKNHPSTFSKRMKSNWSGGTDQSNTELQDMGADAGSEEYIIQGTGAGIRRTVDVTVEHNRISKIGEPQG